MLEPLRRARPPCAESELAVGTRDELVLVDAAQREQKLRPLIEARTDTVEHCRHVLAHVRPVRARAVEGDLLRRRKEAALAAAHVRHDAPGESALQEIDHRLDLARAAPADLIPARLRHRTDLHLHVVEARTDYARAHAPLRDAEIGDRAGAQVAASTLEPAVEVAVR